MFYQLTLQFTRSEIDDAKKVLELAKELDLKRAGLEQILPEPETFPWEEEAPVKPTPQAMEEPAPEPVKPTPQAMEEPAPEPVKPTPAKEITLEELQKAGVAFAKEKGVAVLKAFLTQIGASKICDIPKEKYQEAWEALHA